MSSSARRCGAARSRAHARPELRRPQPATPNHARRCHASGRAASPRDSSTTGRTRLLHTTAGRRSRSIHNNKEARRRRRRRDGVDVLGLVVLLVPTAHLAAEVGRTAVVWVVQRSRRTVPPRSAWDDRNCGGSAVRFQRATPCRRRPQPHQNNRRATRRRRRRYADRGLRHAGRVNVSCPTGRAPRGPSSRSRASRAPDRRQCGCARPSPARRRCRRPSSSPAGPAGRSRSTASARRAARG